LLNHFLPLNRKDSPRYRPWRKVDFQDPGVPECDNSATKDCNNSSQKRKRNSEEKQNSSKEVKSRNPKTKYMAHGQKAVNFDPSVDYKKTEKADDDIK